MFYSADSNQSGTFSFRLFGFPISIHWSFLILPIVFGAGAVSDPIQQTRFILITVIVFFISILGHELGHAFAYRSFGGHARIMIQAMGGMRFHMDLLIGNKRLSSPQLVPRLVL